VTSMLEVIKINQSEIHHRGFSEETDVVDWMIIQYLQFIEQSTERVRTNGSYYHRVSLNKLIRGLPMSGLKTESGMCKRLQNLANQRLVAFYKTNNNLLYFRLGYSARNIVNVYADGSETTYGDVYEKN
jgi:hypothetical protein